MSSFRSVLAAFGAVLLCAPSAFAEAPSAGEGRRRGLDLEVHGGIIGAIPDAGTAPFIDGPILGRTVGGAILYRALPHLAVGVASEAGFFTFASVLPPPGGTHVLPSATYTTVGGVAGPTVRGYIVGHGPVDPHVSLTLGPSYAGQLGSSPGAQVGIIGIDQSVGVDVRLHRRLCLTVSVAFTFLLLPLGGGGSRLPGPEPFNPPFLSSGLRLGGTFTLVE